MNQNTRDAAIKYVFVENLIVLMNMNGVEVIQMLDITAVGMRKIVKRVIHDFVLSQVILANQAKNTNSNKCLKLKMQIIVTKLKLLLTVL